MDAESAHVELPVTAGSFTMMFTSTRRGARLARLLAVQCLDSWGIRYDSPGSRTVALLVAELAANAVQHGHVPGRDFQLLLTVRPEGDRGAVVVRVELSDARTERRPVLERAPEDGEHGRGMLLIDAFADKWGVADRDVGKTVWCESVLAASDL